jgi:hypothetical protein
MYVCICCIIYFQIFSEAVNNLPKENIMKISIRNQIREIDPTVASYLRELKIEGKYFNII